MAVDAQAKMSLGFITLSVRAVLTLLVTGPIAYILLELPIMSTGGRLITAAAVVGLGILLAGPQREGVWVLLWGIYRGIGWLVPQIIRDGQPQRAEVRDAGEAVAIGRVRPLLRPKGRIGHYLDHYVSVPRGSFVADGIFRLDPGGHRVALTIQGPTAAIGTEGYTLWCSAVMDWILQVGEAAQLYSVVTHHDAQQARQAFDSRIARDWPDGPMLSYERDLAALVAEHSLGMRHYVIFCPLFAAKDGVPHLSQFHKAPAAPEAPLPEAERVLGHASRLAISFALEVAPLGEQELTEMLADTPVGAANAAASHAQFHIGEDCHLVATVTGLPASVFAGGVVDAMMRARATGFASLHVIPMERQVARKQVSKSMEMLRMTEKQGAGDEGTALALNEGSEVLAEIANRTLNPVRVALTLSVNHPLLSEAKAAMERLTGVLGGHGFRVEEVTCPGFLPALAVTPGGAPLRRSLILTSSEVALRMLPSLGTPLSDSRLPLLGINQMTGAPAYASVWELAGFAAMILGPQGRGKSMSVKTMAVRHALRGVRSDTRRHNKFIFLDPDNEYRQIVEAMGGTYYELGKDAINCLAVLQGHSPDEAASNFGPVLSVLAGDPVATVDNRPIRRLPDEDEAWLHGEISNFFTYWLDNRAGKEPLLHNLIGYLGKVSMSQPGLSDKEKERCRIIGLRLARYTQGTRGFIFDRPSSFSIGGRSLGIGMQALTHSYTSDITPALALILNNIYSIFTEENWEANRGTIVVVDEAHRFTGDPDAGKVLMSLIREARKYDAGVWMCSQQVGDFLDTDLGKVLSDNSPTKVLLPDESTLPKIAKAFELRAEEVRALRNAPPGRALYIADTERTVVQMNPGALIMRLGNTRREFVPEVSGPDGSSRAAA
jgi:hypothetical protein